MRRSPMLQARRALSRVPSCRFRRRRRSRPRLSRAGGGAKRCHCGRSSGRRGAAIFLPLQSVPALAPPPAAALIGRLRSRGDGRRNADRIGSACGRQRTEPEPPCAFQVCVSSPLSSAARCCWRRPVRRSPRAPIPRPDKPATGDGKDAPKKLDEFAEAEKLLGGPAANPECLWFGRRVVSLLWTRRSRYRVPPSRPLRPVRLPVRPYPGGVSLRRAGRATSTRRRPRDLRPSARVLDQSEQRGEGGGGRGAERHDQPLICTTFRNFCSEPRTNIRNDCLDHRGTFFR